MMTLEDVIRHYEKLVYGHNRLKQIKAVTLEECKRADEWLQIAEWLKELKERREKDVPDPISRQAVLDLIADYDLSMGQVVRGIHALPSGQKKGYTKADYIMALHKEYGCSLARAEEAHQKALEYLQNTSMMKG